MFEDMISCMPIDHHQDADALCIVENGAAIALHDGHDANTALMHYYRTRLHKEFILINGTVSSVASRPAQLIGNRGSSGIDLHRALDLVHYHPHQ